MSITSKTEEGETVIEHNLRKCVECGKGLEPKMKRRKFCSPLCYGNYVRRKFHEQQARRLRFFTKNPSVFFTLAEMKIMYAQKPFGYSEKEKGTDIIKIGDRFVLRNRLTDSDPVGYGFNIENVFLDKEFFRALRSLRSKEHLQDTKEACERECGKIELYEKQVMMDKEAREYIEKRINEDHSFIDLERKPFRVTKRDETILTPFYKRPKPKTKEEKEREEQLQKELEKQSARRRQKRCIKCGRLYDEEDEDLEYADMCPECADDEQEEDDGILFI